MSLSGFTASTPRHAFAGCFRTSVKLVCVAVCGNAVAFASGLGAARPSLARLDDSFDHWAL